MFLEVIIENNDNQVPSVDDLNTWADTYGLSMPVLADEQSIVYQFATGGSIGLPYTVLLDRGMVVQDGIGSASVSQMDNLLGG